MVRLWLRYRAIQTGEASKMVPIDNRLKNTHDYAVKQITLSRIFEKEVIHMPLLGAIIVPHPPLIIPTVGQGQERQVQTTIDTYRAVVWQAAAWDPEVLIVTSPIHHVRRLFPHLPRHRHVR